MINCSTSSPYPIRLREEVVATFVFGVEDTVADDVRKLDLGVLLLTDGQAVAATARDRELEALLAGQLPQATASGRGKIEVDFEWRTYFYVSPATCLRPARPAS